MKLLIVDDELTSRKTLALFSQKIGYEVFSASNGAEAWKLWREKRPRLVVTDWQMPVMDGLELCSKIREEEGDDYTYIVIVTSRDGDTDVIKGMQAGADDYITKPFSKDELAVRLKAGERVLNLQTKDLVIFSLAKLAESRDNETGNHLERIRYYCRALAEDLLKQPDCPAEVTPQFVETIYRTSPLHDIGKVGIPDYILLKPGRLDDEEFEIMKGHTVVGFDTLNEALLRNPKAAYLRMAADIALSHHEKYDGTGYPGALKADEIPMSARITALADVYDALISKRVYKAPLPQQVAESIIFKGSGNHFDPYLVESFKRIRKEFIEIHNQYRQ